MTDTTPQTVTDGAQRPADAPTGRPWLEMTEQEFRGPQSAIQPAASPAGDGCGTIPLDTVAPPEGCENCDADDDTTCGCCPACDTTKVERCVACGKCRCDRHDDCTPPPAAPADVEPAAVRITAAVLAEEHPAAALNEYGSCIAPGFRVGLGTDEQARVHHQMPPIDLTDPDRQSSHERWAEARARVAMYADTLEADGFTVNRREVPTGPILLAMPPEAYPSRIGVYCDPCGHTVSHDYLVHAGMSRAQRLQVARDHLTANEGWSCTPAADLCPSCAAKEAK